MSVRVSGQSRAGGTTAGGLQRERRVAKGSRHPGQSSCENLQTLGLRQWDVHMCFLKKK